MENTARKLWLIILFFTLLSISFNLLRENKKREEILGIDNRSIEEVVVLEDLDIALTPKEENSENISKEGVYVPYYWKTGINIESMDYLLGYVPTIRNFLEYISAKSNYFYGSKPEREFLDPEEIILKDYTLSHGIPNESDFFSWKEDSCSVKDLENSSGKKLFFCENWVNWLEFNLEERTYVLTDCYIKGLFGYCVFEDYIPVYYKEQRKGENRCFGDDISKYCDFTKYLDLVEYI